VSAWLTRETRRRVADVVGEIEKKTSAEIVVTVVPQSASYLHVDLGVGAAFGALALLAYVFLPIEFPDDMGALSVLVAFAVGTVLAGAIRPVKRRLLTARAKRDAAHLSACAVFVDQGIARTRRRTGILVFVSLFEREAAIVPDVGVAIDASFGKGIVAIEDAVRADGSPEAFVKALRKLGDVLAESMPVTEDDTNELPDAVVA
jgi:putative membrane protein